MVAFVIFDMNKEKINRGFAYETDNSAAVLVISLCGLDFLCNANLLYRFMYVNDAMLTYKTGRVGL